MCLTFLSQPQQFVEDANGGKYRRQFFYPAAYDISGGDYLIEPADTSLPPPKCPFFSAAFRVMRMCMGHVDHEGRQIFFLEATCVVYLVSI
jgi:hypothetical protein